MGLPVTLLSLRTRARRRADMEFSKFVSDAEANDMINEAFCELYDVIVQAFENYYCKFYSFSTTAGTATYSLPSDFYKLISIDVQNGLQWNTLLPYQESERNASMQSSSSIPAAALKMRYVPNPTLFVADSDSFDFINGWEALLITDVAIMMLQKEESDTAKLEQRRERQLRRIVEMSKNRDITMPGRVTDVSQFNAWNITNALRYKLYGTNVEFVSFQYLGV